MKNSYVTHTVLCGKNTTTKKITEISVLMNFTYTSVGDNKQNK